VPRENGGGQGPCKLADTGQGRLSCRLLFNQVGQTENIADHAAACGSLRSSGWRLASVAAAGSHGKITGKTDLFRAQRRMCGRAMPRLRPEARNCCASAVIPGFRAGRARIACARSRSSSWSARSSWRWRRQAARFLNMTGGATMRVFSDATRRSLTPSPVVPPTRIFWRFGAACGRIGRTALKYCAYRINLTEFSPQQMCGRNWILITRPDLQHCGSL
jgi:hypothetical protein